MTIEIPTTEPDVVYAGTTIQWTKALADFPAGTWTLTYYLIDGAGNRWPVQASASGTTHAVTVTAASSAKWVAGRYSWTAYAVSGSTTYRVGAGVMEVKADLQTAVSSTLATHARRALAAIEAVLENRASLDQEEFTIAGRSLKRTPWADLIKARDKYKAEVAAEERAERMAAGLGGGGRLLVRLR